MVKKPEFNVEVRAAMVADYKNGISASELSKKYNCHKNTILYQIRKQNIHGTVSNVIGRGSKRKTSVKEDVLIARAVKVNPSATQRNIQYTINSSRQNKISQPTICRRLKEQGIRKYTTKKKPYISKNNKAKRLKFAHDHINKPLEFWRNILWTDESIFSLDGTWGRKFYYSTPSEQLKRAVITPTRHSGGGHIMIWGSISYNGVGPIQILRGNVRQSQYLELLNEIGLVAGCNLIGIDFMLQHDNAPVHKGKIVSKFLKDIGQNVLEWPPQSPDLNVIENVWAYIKREIPCEVGRTEDETWNTIVKVWNNIPTDFIRNLIDSVPRRLSEVLKSKGGNTSY